MGNIKIDEKISLFKEFTFPLAVSGADPEIAGKTRTEIKYPTLIFATYANARSVRRSIKRFMLIRFKEKISRKKAHDIYLLGLHHMRVVRKQAQSVMDSWDDNKVDVVSKAQEIAEARYDAEGKS